MCPLFMSPWVFSWFSSYKMSLARVIRSVDRIRLNSNRNVYPLNSSVVLTAALTRTNDYLWSDVYLSWKNEWIEQSFCGWDSDVTDDSPERKIWILDSHTCRDENTKNIKKGLTIFRKLVSSFCTDLKKDWKWKSRIRILPKNVHKKDHLFQGQRVWGYDNKFPLK